jgi:hypothetical protein
MPSSAFMVATRGRHRKADNASALHAHLPSKKAQSTITAA